MPLESSPEEMIKLFEPGTPEYKELYNLIHKIKPKPTNPVEIALSKKRSKKPCDEEIYQKKIRNRQRVQRKTAQ